MRRRYRRAEALSLPGVDAAPRMATPTSRATSRRKAKHEAPAPKPWLAVVLAVDTANNSGWALRAAGRQLEFGEVDTFDADAVARIVRWAIRCARRLDLPLVLVLEAPWGGTVKTVASLGAARERWMHAWRQYEQASSRVIRVQVATWRAAVLGRHWVSAKREDVRKHEQDIASAMMGEQLEPDEAAALLIARWAVHAAKVGRVIGKRATVASLRAWLEGR